MDQCASDDLQVRPLLGRPQIGARRTLPPPPAAGLLDPADIVAGTGRQMVDVFVVFETDLLPGLDHRVAQQRLVGGVRSQQRPAFAVKFIGLALPALGLFEIGQHIVPRPAAIAELAPMVKILGLPADIDHAVDRTGAAEHPAARIGNRATIGAGVGFGGKAPGDGRVIEQLHIAGRDVDQRVAVGTAGLDQHDPGAGVGAQPVGQHAAGRSGADDDVIRLHPFLPPPLKRHAGPVQT